MLLLLRACLAIAFLFATLVVARLPGNPGSETTITLNANVATPTLKDGEESEHPVKAAARSSADTDKEKKAESAAQPGINKLESLRIPSDSIIVICDSLADVMRLIPKAVVLTPEKYKELEEQIDKLKAQVAQLSSEKPVLPSTCKLTGKVEGDRVYFKAQFVFVTEKPNVTVMLACGQAKIANPLLDDRPAQILNEEYTVLVDKPGEHRLTMELTLKSIPRNMGRGIELDLPRAASTALELDLPPEVKERDLRINDQGLAATLFTLKNGQLTGLLAATDKRGPADKLDLSWKEIHPAPGIEPVLVAEGSIQIHIEPQQIVTNTKLVLKTQAGQTDRWQLILPLGAEVRVAPEDKGRVKAEHAEDVLDDKQRKIATQQTIVLNEPDAEPLSVQVTVRGPALLPGTPFPVGPYLVRGAFKQTGTIVINNSVADLHPRFQPRGSIAPRDLTDDERRGNVAAAFKYWDLPALNDLTHINRNALYLFEVEGERLPGQIEARVVHTLTLTTDNPEKEHLWRVVTLIDAKPVRNEVDHLDVLVPPEWVYDAQRSPGASDRVRAVEFDAVKGIVRFQLKRAPAESLKSFQLTVEGLQRKRPSVLGPETLALPRPVDTLDAGGQGTGHQIVIRAGKGSELLTPIQDNLVLDPVSRETHEQTWKARRLPLNLRLEWRPYRPEVRCEGVVDLRLTPREGHIRHTLRLQFPQEPVTQIVLHVPDVLAGRIQVEGGEGVFKPGACQVKLREPLGKEHLLIFKYSFSLPEEGSPRSSESVSVPLIALDASVQGETRIRVGGEPGFMPSLAGGPWVETNVEEVKGWNYLPMLVARVPCLDQPLALFLGEASGMSSSTILVDRTLIRAAVVQDGSQGYRVSFLISQLAGRSIDIELPAPVLYLGPRATLDGTNVQGTTVDETGQHSEGGRTLRLKLPEISKRPAVLELTYQVPAGRTGGGMLQTVFSPPIVRGDTGKTPTRWQIGLPVEWVAIGPETGSGVGRMWGLRGWLFAPHLTTTQSDLERWFTGAEPLLRDEESERSVPTLVCWRDGLDPLVVTHAPQQAWLMVCSLGLLMIGFALYLLARPREVGKGLSTAWLMPALTALVLAGAIIGLFWPTLLTALVLGCEPGAAVLLVFAGVQWLFYIRYRRQVVFLPSFSRGRSGSSLIRATGSGQRPRAEPSTVDAPPYQGSSLYPPAETGAQAPSDSHARRTDQEGSA